MKKGFSLILALIMLWLPTLAHDLSTARIKPVSFTLPSSMVNSASESRPPSKGAKVLGEILAGTGCGLAMAYIGGAITYTKNQERNWVFNWKYQSAVVGAVIGFTLGTTLGVWLIGNMGDETGSLGATVVGTILGEIASLGLFIAAGAYEYGNIGVGEAIFRFAPYVLIPAVGSTIAFNKTRRYKGGHSSASLFNFDQRHFFLRFPQISFQPSPLRPGDVRLSLDLISLGL